jgi:hypothetical protein
MATRTVGAQGANEFIELTLSQYLNDLESQLQADCLTYVGPLLSGADDRIRYAIEAIKDKKPKLVVMLETIGGFAEVARRISDTFRRHYAVVDFEPRHVCRDYSRQSLIPLRPGAQNVVAARAGSVLERITNITALGGRDDRLSSLVDRVPTALRR